MHAIFFGIKRSFHSSVSILRGFLQPHELTPARYDLLFVVRERGLTWMSDVRRMLGVTRATTSRMVKSLLERGLVILSRPPNDKRQRAITLTPKGEECLRLAIARYRSTGALDFYVETIFEPPCKDPTFRMHQFQRCLAQVRTECGDTSADPDPWDPTDWDDDAIDYEELEFWEFLEPEHLGADEIPIPAPPG